MNLPGRNSHRRGRCPLHRRPQFATREPDSVQIQKQPAPNDGAGQRRDSSPVMRVMIQQKQREVPRDNRSADVTFAGAEVGGVVETAAVVRTFVSLAVAEVIGLLNGPERRSDVFQFLIDVVRNFTESHDH